LRTNISEDPILSRYIKVEGNVELRDIVEWVKKKLAGDGKCGLYSVYDLKPMVEKLWVKICEKYGSELLAELRQGQ